MVELDPSLMLFYEAFRRYLVLTSPLLLRVLVARSPMYFRANCFALSVLAIECYQLTIAPAPPTVVHPSRWTW